MTLFKNSRRFYRAYPQMVQLFRAAPQFFRQIGPTVSDELQIAEIQLVEKGATVSREFQNTEIQAIQKSASVMPKFISFPEVIIRQGRNGQQTLRLNLSAPAAGRKHIGKFPAAAT